MGFRWFLDGHAWGVPNRGFLKQLLLLITMMIIYFWSPTQLFEPSDIIQRSEAQWESNLTTLTNYTSRNPNAAMITTMVYPVLGTRSPYATNELYTYEMSPLSYDRKLDLIPEGEADDACDLLRVTFNSDGFQYISDGS